MKKKPGVGLDLGIIPIAVDHKVRLAGMDYGRTVRFRQNQDGQAPADYLDLIEPVFIYFSFLSL